VEVVCSELSLRKRENLEKAEVKVKIAASVLLKLFINGNKIYTTDATWRMSGTLFSNVNTIQGEGELTGCRRFCQVPRARRRFCCWASTRRNSGAPGNTSPAMHVPWV